jgi:hypothetical protein
MVKKILLFIFVFMLLTIVCGCNDKEQTKEEIINSLLEEEYSNIDIISTTKKDDYSLTSTYTINNANNVTTLIYSIEQYNKLDISNPDIEEKVTKSGKIEYSNGQKKIIEGENISIDINALTLSKLKFSESDFDSVDYNEGKVILKSNNGKRFLNADIDLLNFEIIIEYNNEKINKVTISYKQNNYDVLMVYQIK